MSRSTPSFQTSGDQVHIVRATERQLELDKLPPTKTSRWVTRRKAQVVTAVRRGILSLTEACERYNLSEEEFKSWASLFDNHGMSGLRATRIQEYRSGAESVSE
ncbi:MAG: DUF1153 domain-containing protein [Alphaproteobacteria bacterium]|nr:DUF1153 domain-containing protein [Alphaproteobacteria bacterium]